MINQLDIAKTLRNVRIQLLKYSSVAFEHSEKNLLLQP